MIFEYRCQAGHTLELWLSSWMEAKTLCCHICRTIAQRRYATNFIVNMQTPYFHPGLGRVIRNRSDLKASLAELSERYGKDVQAIPDLDHYVRDGDGVELTSSFGGIVEREGERPRATPGTKRAGVEVTQDELGGESNE